MSRFIVFGLACAVCLGTASTARSVPILQLYVEGATYDENTDTWIASFNSQNPLRVWAIGNVSGPGGKGTIYDVKLAVAFFQEQLSYDGGISLAGSTTGGLGDFVDPSLPDPLSPPRSVLHKGGVPTLSSGKSLPSHGVYGPDTYWYEFALGDFDLSDSPIADFISSFPDAPSDLGGQINVYQITVPNADAQTVVHFDLHGHVVRGNGDSRAVFTPFSHDGEGGGGSDAQGYDPPIPEPASLAVWCALGILGSGAFGYRRRKRRVA